MMQKRGQNCSSLNLVENQLVWVADLRTEPGTWPLGVITKKYPDKSGIVRVVDVKSHDKILRRSVRNLVLVPV